MKRKGCLPLQLPNKRRIVSVYKPWCSMSSKKQRQGAYKRANGSRDKSDRWARRNERVLLLQCASHLAPHCHPTLALKNQSPADMNLPLSHCTISQERPVNMACKWDTQLYTHAQHTHHVFLKVFVECRYMRECIKSFLFFSNTVNTRRECSVFRNKSWNAPPCRHL